MQSKRTFKVAIFQADDDRIIFLRMRLVEKLHAGHWFFDRLALTLTVSSILLK